MARRFRIQGGILSGLLVVVGLFGIAPTAQATPVSGTITADGLTYALSMTATNSPYEDQFTLTISGINGSSDTEGAQRYGFDALSFTPPANYLSATFVSTTTTSPSVYSTAPGGLNSSGCNGSGNFFCFSTSSASVGTTVLPANSTITFVFDITLSSGNFSNYTPDLKINWLGKKNNYDLVSLPITSTLAVTQTSVPTPEPATLALIGSALVGMGAARRRRRRA